MDVLKSAEEVDESQPNYTESPPIKRDKYYLVSNPVFRRIFFIIRFLGCIISLASLITELVYLTTHKFASVTYWLLYLGTTLLKLFSWVTILLSSLKRKVIGKKPKSYLHDLDQDQRQQVTSQFQYQGAFLYSAIALSYYTGFYRLLNAQHFTKAMGIGFTLDLLFTLALMFIQGLNNAVLNAESIEHGLAKGTFQTTCILIKFVTLVDIFFELIMFIFEVYKKQKLAKESVDVVVTLDEEKKRSLYYNRYFKIAVSGFSFAVVANLVLSLTIPSKMCMER